MLLGVIRDDDGDEREDGGGGVQDKQIEAKLRALLILLVLITKIYHRMNGEFLNLW